MTSRTRLALALLAAADRVVGKQLHLGGDLRKFMPRLDQTTSAAKSQAAAAAHAMQMRAIQMRAV